MYWFKKGTDPKKWDAERAKIEVPPPGYTGSLKGTVWDSEAMLEGYNQ